MEVRVNDGVISKLVRNGHCDGAHFADCATCSVSRSDIFVPLTTIGPGTETLTWESGVCPYAATWVRVMPLRVPKQTISAGPIVAVAEEYVPSGTFTVKSGCIVPFRCMNSTCSKSGRRLTESPDWEVRVSVLKLRSNCVI
jgi:hypothetical protein